MVPPAPVVPAPPVVPAVPDEPPSPPEPQPCANANTANGNANVSVGANNAVPGQGRILAGERSWMVLIDGKYSLGPVNLYYMLPFGDLHPNMTNASVVASNHTWNQYDRYGVL